MFQRFILVSILCFLTSLSFAEIKAGIAVRVVTPDSLLPVSGGIGKPNPTEITKGDLSVRALVLENNGVRVAFVSTDFLGFPAVLGDRIREKVEGILPENILIGATHTHSAPDIYGLPDEEGKHYIDLDYVYGVCDKAAEAINKAVENLQPCRLKISSGEAKGKIAYNYYAPLLYDPRCNVIQCIGDDGKAFATLVNYAVHPEVLGAGQGILSPDLIGPLYDRIAEVTGGTGIFMNGAQGGMVTADVRGVDGKDVQTWDECIRIGNLLADEALRIVKDALVQKDPQLYCKTIAVNYPLDNPILKMLVDGAKLKYPINDDGSITTKMSVVNIGNAQMLTIPGEALPNIGYYLKRNMHGEHNFLLGLTNDAFGYILTKEDFNSFKRYEYVTRTSLGEQTGEILVDQALEFVNSLPKPEKVEGK